MELMIKAVTEASAPATGLRIQLSPEALDQIEQLWSSTFLAVDHKAPRSVIVTAAEPEEGTTEIALGLAVVGASRTHGSRVALVDLNLRKPKISQMLSMADKPGITEMLDGSETVSGWQVDLGQSHFTVVPAGRASGSTGPVVDPVRIGSLLRQLLDTHDQVILDAPAVNRNATVQSVAGVSDGVLLVTREGLTRREAVAEAKKRIDLAQGKVLGLVLNMRRFPVPGFLYRRM